MPSIASGNVNGNTGLEPKDSGKGTGKGGTGSPVAWAVISILAAIKSLWELCIIGRRMPCRGTGAHFIFGGCTFPVGYSGVSGARSGTNGHK